METEFKYNVNDPSVFDSIVENAEINKMGLEAVETIEMCAVYFDTPDMDFRKRGIAYRIRQEDDRITATIKWDVNVEDGLHKREEFNLVVNDERFAEAPDIDYIRKQIKIDTGHSISCISLDRGEITHADGHKVPISELEIEWYYGDEDDFISLAGLIQKKYSLESENRSKLQRAYE